MWGLGRGAGGRYSIGGEKKGRPFPGGLEIYGFSWGAFALVAAVVVAAFFLAALLFIFRLVVVAGAAQ